jgi:hypothetical protein
MSSTKDTNLFRSLLSELFWLVEGPFGDPSVLTADSAVSRYIAKKTFGCDRREESEFIASRFSEIPRFF